MEKSQPPFEIRLLPQFKGYLNQLFPSYALQLALFKFNYPLGVRANLSWGFIKIISYNFCIINQLVTQWDMQFTSF